MAWQQFLITFLGNVGTLSFGLQIGWLSPLQPYLQSKNSPLGKDAPPLTDEQISWVVSLLSIVGVFTPPLFGYTMDRFGRKFTLLLTTLPNLIIYLLYIFADSVIMLYCGRAIAGFVSSGSLIAAPIYVNETVMPKRRAVLGSLTGFFINFGVLLSFIFGSYTSYMALNLMCVSFTVIFLLFSIWLPESPVYLMKHSKHQQAKITMQKIWGVQESEKIEEELKLIQTQNNSQHNRIKLKLFVTTRHLRRGLLIGLGIFTFYNFCGYPAVIRYSVDIFDRSGTPYSSDLAAIFLAVTQLIFSLIGAPLVDKIGRKKLIIYNLIGMAVCMSVLTTFLALKQYYPENEIIHFARYSPSVALVGFIILFSCGFGTIPFIIIPELFTAETRAVASAIINVWLALFEFIIVKFYLTMTNVINLWGSTGIFALCNAAGAIFLYFIMFETKGLDSESIQRILANRPINEQQNENKILLNKFKKKPEIVTHDCNELMVNKQIEGQEKSRP